MLSSISKFFALKGPFSNDKLVLIKYFANGHPFYLTRNLTHSIVLYPLFSQVARRKFFPATCHLQRATAPGCTLNLGKSVSSSVCVR